LSLSRAKIRRKNLKTILQVNFRKGMEFKFDILVFGNYSDDEEEEEDA